MPLVRKIRCVDTIHRWSGVKVENLAVENTSVRKPETLKQTKPTRKLGYSLAIMVLLETTMELSHTDLVSLASNAFRVRCGVTEKVQEDCVVVTAIRIWIDANVKPVAVIKAC